MPHQKPSTRPSARSRKSTARGTSSGSEKRYRSRVTIEWADPEAVDTTRLGSMDWPSVARAKAGAFIAAGHYIMNEKRAMKTLYLAVTDQHGEHAVLDHPERIYLQDFDA